MGAEAEYSLSYYGDAVEHGYSRWAGDAYNARAEFASWERTLSLFDSVFRGAYDTEGSPNSALDSEGVKALIEAPAADLLATEVQDGEVTSPTPADPTGADDTTAQPTTSSGVQGASSVATLMTSLVTMVVGGAMLGVV